MRIDVTDSSTHQAAGVDESQHLGVSRNIDTFQVAEEVQDLGARIEEAAREFADDERVNGGCCRVEESRIEFSIR